MKGEKALLLNLEISKQSLATMQNTTFPTYVHITYNELPNHIPHAIDNFHRNPVTYKLSDVRKCVLHLSRYFGVQSVVVQRSIFYR